MRAVAGKPSREASSCWVPPRVSAHPPYGAPTKDRGAFSELVDQVMGEGHSLYALHRVWLLTGAQTGSGARPTRPAVPAARVPLHAGAPDVASGGHGICVLNRRVSAPRSGRAGGQVLGATPATGHRLLAFDLETEAEGAGRSARQLAAHFEEGRQGPRRPRPTLRHRFPVRGDPRRGRAAARLRAPAGHPTKSPDTAVPGAPQTPPYPSARAGLPARPKIYSFAHVESRRRAAGGRHHGLTSRSPYRAPCDYGRSRAVA